MQFSLIITMLALAVPAVFYWISAIRTSTSAAGRSTSGGPTGARAARGQRPVLPVRPLRRAGGAAVRGVAVPRHRAVAPGGGGIGRSEARHAEGHHARHVHTDRVGVLSCFPQSIGDRRRLVQARRLGRTAARRFPRHLRRADRQALALVAVTGLVASFHTIIYAYGPADLFAVARRLFPARAVDHARHAQDPAHRAWSSARLSALPSC